MDNGRTIAWLGVSIALFACGANASATTAPDATAPVHIAAPATAQYVSPADGSTSGRHEPGAARGETHPVPVKAEETASPGSDSFVLLGMLVVLIGVVARGKRRFSRSGTILSR